MQRSPYLYVAISLSLFIHLVFSQIHRIIVTVSSDATELFLYIHGGIQFA